MFRIRLMSTFFGTDLMGKRVNCIFYTEQFREIPHRLRFKTQRFAQNTNRHHDFLSFMNQIGKYIFLQIGIFGKENNRFRVENFSTRGESMSNKKNIELFSTYFVLETIKNAERNGIVTLRMWIDLSGLKMNSSHLRRGWIEFLWTRAWEIENVDACAKQKELGLSYWINVSSETVCPGYFSAECVFKSSESSTCSHNLFMSQRMLLQKCSRWMSKWGFGGASRRKRKRVQVPKRVKVYFQERR